MARLNLVDESHRLLSELVKARGDFRKGVIDGEQSKHSVSLFNSSARAIGVAITSEMWYKTKKRNGK